MKLKASFLILLCFATALSQKPPLDHDIYDKWPSIRGTEISRDGNWLLYGVGPAVGDAELFIRSLDDETVIKVPRGANARFTFDSRFAVATIVPAKADADKARKDKKPAPKNAIAIIDLLAAKVTSIENVPGFRLAQDDKGWVAFIPDKTPATPLAGGQPPKEEPKSEKKKDHALGKDLVLMHVPTGRKLEIPDVVDYVFDKSGDTFIYTRSTKDGKEDGVYKLELAASGISTPATALIAGLGNYKGIAVSDKTGDVAFITDRDDYKSEQPGFTLYVTSQGEGVSRAIAKQGAGGIPDGWWISPTSNVTFSESGNRITFRTVLRPTVEPKKEDIPVEDQVSLDVWNWRDPELQPMQLLGAAAERNRTFAAIYDLRTKSITQLETPEIRGVSVGARGDARYALGSDNRPYRQLVSWDDTYTDYYLIDLDTGKRTRIAEKSGTNVSLSPDAKYAFWYDQDVRAWYTLETRTGIKRNVSAKIPNALFDEEDDHPAPPPGLGSAGWTKGDALFVIYDAYDLWALDPSGQKAPINVTDGLGRAWSIRLRNIRLDREVDHIGDTLLLSAVNLKSKASGFYRDQIGRRIEPQRLIMEDRAMGMPTKADGADTVYFTKQTFTEFPDVWVSDLEFKNLYKVTDANPLQKQYNWGTSELIEWTSLNGQKLRGILRKPEDFSPLKTYPMIVYCYETLTETLHSYRSPGPSSGAGISPSFYTSRGYIVFEPDIPYQIGYPGQSAKDAILPGVSAVLAKGFVDPKRIGLLGHSWGGYQTAYLVTQSDMFRAAIAGAPVSNMISAYGGIRWGPGMVRQFQYEKGQSRIGGSLWERPLLYIENSPIFWVEKVRTPLLLLHNDQDDAVPWYQSIEMFTALRRLGKPSWFINYNGEFHGIRKRANQKDWTVRMQQYFDHYLKNAPPPKWLIEGIPATLKGKEFGLGPVRGGG